MSLASVRVFQVPQHVVDHTERAIQEAGDEGYERFVLWSGTEEGDTFCVNTAHVPPQDAYKTSGGLLVRVGGEALHALNTWLYEHNERLAVQVHAHPTNAFHSDTDSAYPIVTARGALSIVAAWFARDGILAKQSAVYRLDEGWTRVRGRKLKRLMQVI